MPQAASQPPGLFICYRRDDTAGHAGRLYDYLSAHFGGEHIFMDIDVIEPGEDFVQAIESAVGSCEILLALIGQNWLISRNEARRLDNPNDFVRLEIATALARGIGVVPVLVQRAQMPSPQDVPEDLLPFVRRNAHELSDQRWNHDVARLIDALEKILARRREARRAAAQQAAERRQLEEGVRRLAEENEQLRRAAAETERQAREVRGAELKRREAEEAAHSRDTAQSSTASVEAPTKLERINDYVNVWLQWLEGRRLLGALVVLLFIVFGVAFLLPAMLLNTYDSTIKSADSVATATPTSQPTPTTGMTATPQPIPTIGITSAPSPTSMAYPSPTPADTALQVRVHKALTGTPQLSAANINASVLDGRVRLVGTVSSEALKQYAGRVAYSVNGVVGVDNEILVAARTPTPTPKQTPSPEEQTDSDSPVSATITLDIDPTTGLIAAPTCPIIRTKTFVIGTEPHKHCGPQYHRN